MMIDENEKSLETFTFQGFSGEPDAIRTHGLQSRSLSLYPAELRAHIKLFCRNLQAHMQFQSVCSLYQQPLTL